MENEFCVRILFLFFIIFLSTFSVSAQKDEWFYLRARDTSFSPTFERKGDYLNYTGSDTRLKAALKAYKIKTFKKTWKHAKKENLKKTFFVIANKRALMTDLLQNTSHLFEYGELIADEDKKIFEPNDYGLTSTIGDNKGLKVNLDYLDFMEVPKAWYYTVGNPETIIGISDASVDTTNIEFAGKTKVVKKSKYSGGHGNGVTSLAAAQGDNGYGVPGVCYNCGIYTTFYGSFKGFEQLLELSEKGVKVINCSWYSSYKAKSGQDAINKMFDNGTLLVVAAGNKNWIETKSGEIKYYPASYDHVISVSSAMYKYETISENILEEPNGKKYAENIKGFVGRTMGFTDKDVSKPHIYPVSVTSLNTEVDILAPSTGTFLYGRYLNNDENIYDTNEHTSNATPLVTGTIGLMLSLYPCLPIDEVESILKMTSLNIDDIEANKPFAGKYGAGMLNTGKSVAMVFDMFAEKGPVKIENQRFSRWDFKLTSLSEVVMKNQEFTENATLNLTSKKQIVISEKTVLKPNVNGKIHLKIDPSLKKECELQLRDPSILNE